LKAQIDAAKWTMAQKTLTPSQLEDTYFGGAFSTAPERVDPAVGAVQVMQQRFGKPSTLDNDQA